MSGWDERPDARSSRTRGAWEEYEDQTYDDGEYEDEEGNIVSSKTKKSKAMKKTAIAIATVKTPIVVIPSFQTKAPSTSKVTQTTVITSSVMGSTDDSWDVPAPVHNPNEPSEAEQLAIDDLFGITKDEETTDMFHDNSRNRRRWTE